MWSEGEICLPSPNSGMGRGWGRNLTLFNTLLPCPVCTNPRDFANFNQPNYSCLPSLYYTYR